MPKSTLKNRPSSIEDKLKAKFGDKFLRAKDKEKEKVKKSKEVVLSKKSKLKGGKLSALSDISDNSPDSSVTKEKLKGLIRSGGFHFNDQERNALAEILKV